MQHKKKNQIFRTCVRRAQPSARWHGKCAQLMDDVLPRAFNAALKESKRLDNEGERVLSFFDMNSGDFLRDLRKAVPELLNFNACITSKLINRLGVGLEMYASGKKRMPRYKNGSRTIDSFTISYRGFRIRRTAHVNPRSKAAKDPNRKLGKHWGIHIKGMGFCKFKGSPPKGDIREVTVQRTARRVNFLFNVAHPAAGIDRSDEPVTGIDVGTKDMITLSSGEKIPGHRRDLDRIKELDRKLARQKKGSKSYEKTRRSRKKEWQRISDSEKGFQQRMTTDIVRNHGPNFAMEEKVASGLMKRRKGEGKRGRKRNRDIQEQCWGRIAHMIGYKAAEAGGWLRTVNPAYTSLDCHRCGSRKAKEDLPLDDPDRLYECSCGMVMDRDENGAINIALKSLGEAPGRAEPGGVRLSCSGKQPEEGKPQNSASSRLQAANPNPGAHCGGARVSGSHA